MLLVALLWAPITWHCHLETLPALDFLACCAHEETQPHQDADCASDGCAVVESGDYKTSEQQLFVSPPLAIAPPGGEPAKQVPDAASQRIAMKPPPPQFRTWQFTFRTALPVRAPSFVS